MARAYTYKLNIINKETHDVEYSYQSNGTEYLCRKFREFFYTGKDKNSNCLSYTARLYDNGKEMYLDDVFQL